MISYNDKRYLISLIIIFLFNILLTQLPLTSVFGFEFSALNSILFVIISGLLVISFLKRGENFVKRIINILPVFLLLPLIISVSNSLLTTTCSLMDGFLFYIIITAPAVVIGCALALLSYYLFPKFPRTLFFLVVLIIALIPVFEIYFNPQIYFYNPLIGFFPGTIYDERLSVSFNLIVYRLLNSIFFLLIIYIVKKILFREIRINRFIFTLLVLASVVAFIWISPLLGFATTKTRIESSLKGKCFTEHFEIIYDTSIDSSYLKYIVLNHEYYYFELKKFFLDEPSEKIVSFVFKNNRQKGELFGSENADVAKPWLFQIYTIADNYNSTLKHEIAHIFSEKFGVGPFKVAHNFNPALIEGIAEAAAPLYNTWYIDQIASVAYNNNYKYTIGDLYRGLNFFGQTSGLSYVYAGSFTGFIINRYGIKKFREWYRGIPFYEVYKLDLTNIANIYYEYLKQLGFINKQNTAQLYFARQTIFSKYCPRYIADQLETGWRNYDNNTIEAESIFNHINSITQNYSALSGLVLAKIKLKKEKEALELLEKEISKYKKGSYYYSLELLRGDLLIRNRKYELAAQQYHSLNDQKSDLHYNYLSQLRLGLLTNKSLIYDYITGTDSSKYDILVKYNNNSYDYSSFPVLIDLAETLHKPYKDVLSLFNKDIFVNDIYSSYGACYLSNYMMENLDFVNGRKMAALAADYKDADGIQFFLRSHLLKTDWAFSNYDKIRNSVKFIHNALN